MIADDDEDDNHPCTMMTTTTTSTERVTKQEPSHCSTIDSNSNSNDASSDHHHHYDQSNRNHHHHRTDSHPQLAPTIESLVHQFWLESSSSVGGLGIAALQQKVQAALTEYHQRTTTTTTTNNSNPSSSSMATTTTSSSSTDATKVAVEVVVTKARIKRAKSLLPYRYMGSEQQKNGDTSRTHNNENNNNDDSPPNMDKYNFVVQKIQERQSLRNERRYEQADWIHRGLQAMGVELNDIDKTWWWSSNNSSKVIPETLATTNTTTARPTTTGVACHMCGHYFASRNLVFKHLRDSASGCGTTLFANGQTIPMPATSNPKKKTKKKTLPSAPGRTAQYAPASHCVWLGDLPLPWTRPTGQYKRLRALLWAAQSSCSSSASSISSSQTQQRHTTWQDPWIKKVIRKAYRSSSTTSSSITCGTGTAARPNSGTKNDDKKGSNGTDMQNEVSGNTDKNRRTTRNGCGGSNADCAYLGYAILVFRDEAEATLARQILDDKLIRAQDTFRQQSSSNKDSNSNGKQSSGETIDLNQDLPSFRLKARPVLKGDCTAAQVAWSTTTTTENLSHKQDPPLVEQLRPLSLEELHRRIHRLENRNAIDNSFPSAKTETTDVQEEPCVDETSYLEQHEAAVERLAVLLPPIRPEQYLQGRPIPEHLLQPLYEMLPTLRWPARNDRPRLTSQRYFVLPTNVANDKFYNELRLACRALMDWADPDYYYSGIAVTKNFVASPHIDIKDQTYQYAVSLGDFSGGGELCVEGDDNGDGVHVITTKDSIAKVDGRRVHWVRTWEQGDRYSLIFYDTSDRSKSQPHSS